MRLTRVQTEGLFDVSAEGALVRVFEAVGGEQIVVQIAGAELTLGKYEGPSSGSIGDVSVHVYATLLSRVIEGRAKRLESVVVHLESSDRQAWIVIPEYLRWRDIEPPQPWGVLGDNTESLDDLVRGVARNGRATYARSDESLEAPLLCVVGSGFSNRLFARYATLIPGSFVLENAALMLATLTQLMTRPWVGWWIRWGTASLLWSVICFGGCVAISVGIVLVTAFLGLIVPIALICYPLYRVWEYVQARKIRLSY